MYKDNQPTIFWSLIPTAGRLPLYEKECPIIVFVYDVVLYHYC